PAGETERHRAGDEAAPAPSRGPQVCGWEREHLADRVVELPDAVETGRARDGGDRQVGGLDQYARRLRPLSARDRERAGAQLAQEQAMEMALTHREPAGQPGDTVPI